jgi:hypothetical protein
MHIHPALCELWVSCSPQVRVGAGATITAGGLVAGTATAAAPALRAQATAATFACALLQLPGLSGTSCGLTCCVVL